MFGRNKYSFRLPPTGNLIKIRETGILANPQGKPEKKKKGVLNKNKKDQTAKPCGNWNVGLMRMQVVTLFPQLPGLHPCSLSLPFSFQLLPRMGSLRYVFPSTSTTNKLPLNVSPSLIPTKRKTGNQCYCEGRL